MGLTTAFGRKIDASNAEIVFVGTGFGTEAGSVVMAGAGTGSGPATIKDWTDTYIKVDVPVDTVYKQWVVKLPGGGAATMRNPYRPPTDFTPATDGAAASWSVTSITASADNITISGTGLSAIGHVVINDNSSPSDLYFDALFVEESGDLIVTWPDVFSGVINEIILVSSDGLTTSEHTGSWAPVTIGDGVINTVSGQNLGTYLNDNVSFRSFTQNLGTLPGRVFLTPQGGAEQERSVLSWSPGFIRYTADPLTTYTDIRVLESDGTQAVKGGAFPATFTSTGLIAAVSAVSQPSAGSYKITGDRLNNVGFIEFVTQTTANFLLFNPTIWWNDPASGNTAAGNSNISFSSGEITFDTSNTSMVGDKLLFIRLGHNNGEPMTVFDVVPDLTLI